MANNENDEGGKVSIDLDKDEKDQQPSQSGNTGKGVLLQYQLAPLKDAAVLSIQRQSPAVTTFVRKLGTFQATNGVRIMLANTVAQWKESKNIIYLDDGSGKSLNRPDITRFPINGGKIRDNKIALFHAAMKELVTTVMATNASSVIIESRNKSHNAKITLP